MIASLVHDLRSGLVLKLLSCSAAPGDEKVRLAVAINQFADSI